MRGLEQTWLQLAVGATAWLIVTCALSACAGPGLEPPGGRSEDGAPLPDGGAGTGGTGANGGAGGTGMPSGDPNQPGDGDGDGDGVIDHGGDAGEAERDASVDEDGGSDPQDLEP